MLISQGLLENNENHLQEDDYLLDQLFPTHATFDEPLKHVMTGWRASIKSLVNNGASGTKTHLSAVALVPRKDTQ